jgi:putative oxidoreductase
MFRRLLHGGASVDGALANLGLALARVVAGGMLAFGHGMGKLPPSEKFIEGVAALGFPMPEVFAWAAGLAEFGGGILLMLGLLTRPAAAFIAFTMATAAFGKHAGDAFDIKERALLYLVLAVVFITVGPGRLSVDTRLR